MLHETFGYYAQGVTEATAVLPSGWRDRLIPFETPATGAVTAYCLEPHDLWISKAIAHRPKDIEFCDALVERGIVDPATLDPLGGCSPCSAVARSTWAIAVRKAPITRPG